MELWEKIVLLRLNGTSTKALSIRSSKDAARVLLKGWPTREGKCYRRAILNCSAAVHGRVPHDLAQWSFIVAAMEAAMSYEVVDRFDNEIAAICQELLEEDDAPAGQVEVKAQDENLVNQSYWWPKRQDSGPLAQ